MIFCLSISFVLYICIVRQLLSEEVQCTKSYTLDVVANCSSDRGPQGFWGSGENGYLFSGSWGALVIILGELGSKLIILGI